MRKVFLKSFFILFFAVLSAGFLPGKTFAGEEPSSTQVEYKGEDYIYVKIAINGVDYVFVFDKYMRLVDVYPDGCGGGGNGGH